MGGDLVRGLAIGLAAGVGSALATRWRPSWIVVGGAALVTAALLGGVEYRGSTRWIEVPGLGRVSTCEPLLAFACLLAASGARRTRSWVGPLVIALALIQLGARSYALLALAAGLFGVRERLRGPAAVLVGSWGIVVGLALLNLTAAGERVRGFLLQEGAGGFTEAKLAAIRAGAAWTSGRPPEALPWSEPLVRRDFTFLWDGWALGWGLAWPCHLMVLLAAAAAARGLRTPFQIFAALAVLKGLAHLGSCLGESPVVGMSAPFLTGSGSEWLAVGLVAGSATAWRSAVGIERRAPAFRRPVAGDRAALPASG
ncbi:MAG: hypothetical protein AAFZ65_09465 [Planctomycetota bacterium]